MKITSHFVVFIPWVDLSGMDLHKLISSFRLEISSILEEIVDILEFENLNFNSRLLKLREQFELCSDVISHTSQTYSKLVGIAFLRRLLTF